MLNKKSQIGGFSTGWLGTILIVMLFMVVFLAILLGWAKPALGKVAEWVSSFW